MRCGDGWAMPDLVVDQRLRAARGGDRLSLSADAHRPNVGYLLAVPTPCTYEKVIRARGSARE